MRIKTEDQKTLTIVLAAYIQNMEMWEMMAARVKKLPEPVRESMSKMKAKGQDLLDKYGKKQYLDEYKAYNSWQKDIV